MGRKMPDNPNTWAKLINSIPPEFTATLLAFFVAVVRVIYDKEETNPMRVFLEATLCGLLTLSAVSAVHAMGYSGDWDNFIGGFIGFSGSAYIRNLAMNIISRKSDKL